MTRSIRAPTGFLLDSEAGSQSLVEDGDYSCCVGVTWLGTVFQVQKSNIQLLVSLRKSCRQCLLYYTWYYTITEHAKCTITSILLHGPVESLQLECKLAHCRLLRETNVFVSSNDYILEMSDSGSNSSFEFAVTSFGELLNRVQLRAIIFEVLNYTSISYRMT